MSKMRSTSLARKTRLPAAMAAAYGLPEEEALKAVVIIGLFRINRIGLMLDAVIMGFAVGAGFSVVENIFYLLRFPELDTPVWMVRGIGTAIMKSLLEPLSHLSVILTAEPEYEAAYRAWRKRKPFPLKGSPEPYPKREELYDRPVFRRR